jgi:WD40 repeat protein
MKLLAINDTFRNTPLKNEEKHIIYSLSWHPTSTKLALSGSLGYIMIYDALKSKLITYYKCDSSASYKVDWNQKDPNLILFGL